MNIKINIMKHKFHFTSYQEDGVFNVGIKCNRPFEVTIGKDDTTYDNQSDYDGDGEHILYMQFPFDIDVRVENGLIDIDGRRLLIQVFDIGLWDLSLEEKKNALLHNAHLRNLWIEADFKVMQLSVESTINNLLSSLEEQLSTPSSIHLPCLRVKFTIGDNEKWDGYLSGEGLWNGWDVVKVDSDTLESMRKFYKDEYNYEDENELYNDVEMGKDNLTTLYGYCTQIVRF